MNLSNNTNHFPGFTRKIRVAVCLCGHSDQWKAASTNIKNFFTFTGDHPVFEVPFEFDYFIHTFDVPQPDIQDMIDVYAPKAGISTVKTQYNSMNSAESMFYSFERCVMLKQEYELNNDIQYDIVVKVNMSTVYDPAYKFPIERILPKHCYTTSIKTSPSDFNYFDFDDTLFYGNSPTMDLVADLYSSQRTNYSSPGCMLYNHLINSAIHPVERKICE